jgi:hypothetical protein
MAKWWFHGSQASTHGLPPAPTVGMPQDFRGLSTTIQVS